MQIALTFIVLQAVFSMSSDNLPITRSVLAGRLGLTGPVLERHLLALEESGFIDARRLRLTLPGLAMAASLRARRSQPASVAA
jgi:hypothetical protein